MMLIREESMTCHRRRGLLVKDQCYGLLDHCLSLTVSRCISCGNITDPVILRNRQEQRARLATVQQGKPLVSIPAA
jgi:hypothetical protein